MAKGEVIIEVKSSSSIKSEYFNGLKKFKKENSCRRALLVSQVPHKKTVDGVEIYPWKDFLEELWAGEIIK